MVPVKTLANGVTVPMLGYGVYTIRDEQTCIQCVLDALAAGFRHIDTAAIYQNEPAVGKALKESGLPRNEIFLTTKLWVQDDGYDRAKAAIDAALKRLDTDYVDCLMIHEPMGDIYGQWRAMEEAYEAGKVRALGVSNMYADRLTDFCLHVKHRPLMNQVRTNPYFQHRDTLEYEDLYGIVHEAHSPFGQGNAQLLSDPVLVQIAQAHQKNVGQLILGWLVQRGMVTLTRTVKPERMRQNMDIFDLNLSEEEMDAIARLDRPDGNAFDNRNPKAVQAINQWRYCYDGRED